MLPPVAEVVRVYGSWSKARTAVSESARVPALRALHRRYMAGSSSRELAEEVGVSRDTLLVAFKEAGLTVRSAAEAGAVRRQRADAALEARIIEIFRATHGVRTASEVTRTSLTRTRRILAQAGIALDAYRPWREETLSGPRTMPPDDALVVLRRAERLAGGNLTRKRYEQLAKARLPSSRPRWPLSSDTLLRALGVGTWNEALGRAGVGVGPSSGTRARGREAEQRWLRQLTRRLGRAPTMPEYDATRTSGMLSAQALTKRLGRWRDVLERAGVAPPT